MRIAVTVAFGVLLASGTTYAQQSAPQDPTAPNSDNSSEPQKVGGRISAPVAVFNPDPEYTEHARRKGIEGVCIIGLIVDAQGHPQNPRVVKSLEPGLDKQAIDAVKKWRFKPAMKDGTTPIPVMVSVEVEFHLHRR